MYSRIDPFTLFTFLTLLCLFVINACWFVNHDRVSEIVVIYIRPSGDVEPPNSPVLTIDNETYVVLSDIVGKIVVERDDIVLDGKNHTVSVPPGSSLFNGVEIVDRHNVSIKNLVIEGFIDGIYVESSDDIEIEHVIARGNKYGLVLGSSRNCIVMNSYFYNNSWTGISLVNSTGNSLFNNTIVNNQYGVSVEYSHGNIIAYNNIFDNTWVGVRLSSSDNNTLEGNIIGDNGDGVTLWGSTGNFIVDNTIKDNELLGVVLVDSHSNVVSNNSLHRDSLATYRSYGSLVSNNTVNDKPLIYCENAKGGVVTGEAGQVVLNKCSGLMVEDMYITNSDIGVFSFASNNLLLRNLVLRGNEVGVVFESSSESIVRDIVAENNTHGVIINYSNDIAMENSFLAGNRNGVFIRYSSGVLINKNTIRCNRNGLNFYMSAFNAVLNNVIQGNKKGVIIYQSFDNLVANNDFIDNEVQVYVEKGATGNKWDLGYPGGGNHWSNYMCIDERSGVNQDEEGSDGICDEPYKVSDLGDIDKYPFKKPLFTTQWPVINETVAKSETVTESPQILPITTSPLLTPLITAEREVVETSLIPCDTIINTAEIQVETSSPLFTERWEGVGYNKLLIAAFVIALVTIVVLIALHVARKHRS